MLFWRVLKRGLQVNDAALNADAAEMIFRRGPDVASLLLPDVVDRTQPAKYRVRLLALIKRLGAVAQLAGYTDLAVVARLETNAEVRSALEEIVGPLPPPLSARAGRGPSRRAGSS